MGSPSEKKEEAVPIYEYRCPKCGKEFEELVRPGQDEASCPACGADRCQRLLSSCAVRAGDASAAPRPSGGCGGGGFT